MPDFDYSRLRGRIVERYGSVSSLCVAKHLSTSTLGDRLNGKRAFRDHDIFLLCAPDCLDIKAEDIGTYFFKEKVR